MQESDKLNSIVVVLVKHEFDYFAVDLVAQNQNVIVVRLLLHRTSSLGSPEEFNHYKIHSWQPQCTLPQNSSALPLVHSVLFIIVMK